MIVSFTCLAVHHDSDTDVLAAPPLDLDIPTLTALLAHQSSNPPHLFLPLNTSYALPSSLTTPTSTRPGYSITELDWWESRILTVSGLGSARITALPCQHFTSRGLFDRNRALWASWAVEVIRGKVGERSGVGEDGGLKKDLEIGAKIWFGGDTGEKILPSSSAAAAVTS